MDENQMADMSSAIRVLMENFVSYATQVCETVIPVIAQWYAAIYEQYLACGAPYGETQSGCIRWMEELAEVRRLEAEAERIISHHQGLAYLRKRLAEQREPAP